MTENIFRSSSYNIQIKINQNSDKFLTVHGYSGAIDVVSKNIAQFLISLNTFSFDDISTGHLPFSKPTFDKLFQRGYITNKSPEEEETEVLLLLITFPRGIVIFVLTCAIVSNLFFAYFLLYRLPLFLYSFILELPESFNNLLQAGAQDFSTISQFLLQLLLVFFFCFIVVRVSMSIFKQLKALLFA